MSRARMAKAMLKLAAKTDIKAGTLSPDDRGDPAKERHSPFNPMRQIPGIPAAEVGGPGWVYGGFCLARCLEFSAREKGIRFILNRHMDEIIREERFSGRVLGIKASYTPRFDPNTGVRLESFWQSGNTDERAPTIHIRARKAVIVGTGGHLNNRYVRTMFDPRLHGDVLEQAEGPLLGPHGQDASGIVAGMTIGANLAGMMQNYGHPLGSPRIGNTLATRDSNSSIFPGHPSFLFAKAKGIAIGNAGWEHVIVRWNQVGKRFYSESAIPNSVVGNAKYPPGQEGTRKPFTATDWRNASTAQIKSQFTKSSASDAALAINEGSQAPDFQSGPVWAIFDDAAIKRGGWKVRYPYIAEPPDGYFHKADTLAELATKVMAHSSQKMPLKYLEATVARYNGLADKGVDEDFEKPVMHRIDTPPFYAAWAPIAMLDIIRWPADQRQGTGRGPSGGEVIPGSTGRRRGQRWRPAARPRSEPQCTVTAVKATRSMRLITPLTGGACATAQSAKNRTDPRPRTPEGPRLAHLQPFLDEFADVGFKRRAHALLAILTAMIVVGSLVSPSRSVIAQTSMEQQARCERCLQFETRDLPWPSRAFVLPATGSHSTATLY